MPPVLQIRTYQQRWIDDETRFKIAVKSARIGFSYGTGLEAIFDCLRRLTTWTILSASQPQSIEFVEMAARNIEAIKATAQVYEEPFADEMGKTDVLVKRIQFANGSRIMALACSPRTARGYPGNAVLDEFAHHENSYAIWAAVSRQVALSGSKLRVLSTPNGEQGKFFDLAKGFGLTDGVQPAANPAKIESWSCHWVDVDMAIADGCPIDMRDIQSLYRGDAETMRQEFYCAFLKAVGAWLDLELIAAAEDDDATMELPQDFKPSGMMTLGIDLGRSGDRTCYWLDEHVGDISWARAVGWIHNMPFFDPQGNDQIHALTPFVELADRVALDSTGMGLPIYEYFNTRFPGKVMGVNFGGSIKRMNQGDSDARSRAGLAESVRVKTDMSVRMRRRMEQRKNRIPRNMDVRQELQAIKREQSGNAITFDAPRIELDTPSGNKRKAFSHAEAFWAKAMADLAAERSAASLADGFMISRARHADLALAAIPEQF